MSITEGIAGILAIVLSLSIPIVAILMVFITEIKRNSAKRNFASPSSNTARIPKPPRFSLNNNRKRKATITAHSVGAASSSA